jgi:signal peptidase II
MRMRSANFMPPAKQPNKKRRAPARPKQKAAPRAINAAAMGSLFQFGLMIAAAVLVFDQATKYLVLYGMDLATRRAIYVTPFMDFVLAMNTGISYGMFPQDGNFGRWVLFGVKVGAAIWFFFWLHRTHSKLTALSLGLLIGGAIGNAIDRALQGAVVDFVSLHAAGFRWYIFNLADAAIVAGVAGLLYDALTVNALKSPPKRGI